MWKNVRLRSSFLFLSLLASSFGLLAQTEAAHSPKLLLNSQRLRRLQRDRTRQTVRWINFEKRVETVSNSSERGFELALYYSVTHDEKLGKEAVEWAHRHPCEQRQVALVLDWVSELVPADYLEARLDAKCQTGQNMQAYRDALFMKVASGGDVSELVASTQDLVLKGLQSGAWQDPANFYAALEYLYAVRSEEHTDLRQSAPEFFSSLPATFLLSMSPERVEHPDWRDHTAALALVGIDPNMEGSQFLQGWAMEDRQMLRDGEGVAYEFLWADPYLPGVGYENLDPWSYHSDGSLFARADWNVDSCWIHISPTSVDQQNCPAGWRQKTMQFGNLKLVPLSGSCVDIPSRRNRDDVIVSRFQTNQPIYVVLDKATASLSADASGMWKAPANAQSRVCTSLDTLKVPQAHKSPRE